MRLLDRYLLRELLVPLGYCLGGFLILWIAFDMFSELGGMQDDQMSARDIANYYCFSIPQFLPVALPVALLLALLYALTNHARHHELTAIRAAGVSLGRLCAPYLGIGFLAGAALFLMNEYCSPWAADIAERIRDPHPKPRPLSFHNTPARRFWVIGTYNPVTGEMTSPMVDWQSSNGLWRQISADRAIRTNGAWTFYCVNEYKQYATHSPAVALPHTNVMAFPEFTETPAMIRIQMQISDQFRHQTRTHRADIPLRVIRDFLRLNPTPEPGLRVWLDTKLHGRFAGVFTCLVVVVIAVPFAAASGRRNVFVGVAASITFFFVYYLLQQVGFAYGQAGRVPPWLGAWLPNLVFGIAGLWMMTRVR
jgi:lipopolysaccharide export system permease protein